MRNDIESFIARPKFQNILLAFQIPKTPKTIEKKFGLKKLKTKQFIQNGLLECLNPEAQKGRLYVLTKKARRILNLPCDQTFPEQDANLIGWVFASPKQRLALLQTIAIDPLKRTSENLRRRAAKLNPRMTRISTKSILKELISKDLVETEKIKNFRFYWISKKGKALIDEIYTFQKWGS